MQARLILLDPPAARRELKLSLPATIGRSREASIKLVHSQVSRVHCEFFERDGLLHVRDLGSTNGTYVGGVRINESPVAPGQTVTIGAVTLQAVYEPTAGATPASGAPRGTDTIRKTAEATLRPETSEVRQTPAGGTQLPPPLPQDKPASAPAAPAAVEWEELELEPLDEEPAAADRPGNLAADSETDDSLDILPPQSDEAAPSDEELRWRVPEPPGEKPE